MRTFIAVPLSMEARALLSELQAKMRSFGADVRWTAISSIHLTLKFLGEIEPAELPRLVTLLRAASASEPSFTLSLRGLGGFPNLRNPRVFWCGLEGELQPLASLQQKVEQACLVAGFAPEERPFQPHLTLGRVRGKSNLQPLLDYIKIASTGEQDFGVREFNIYQSTLRPHGAVYTMLETMALKSE
jgi:RNA 2',3'-cyclic 3'-phosphodiesterase